MTTKNATNMYRFTFNKFSVVGMSTLTNNNNVAVSGPPTPMIKNFEQLNLGCAFMIGM